MLIVVVKFAMRLFFNHPPIAIRLFTAIFSPIMGV